MLECLCRDTEYVLILKIIFQLWLALIQELVLLSEKTKFDA